ERAIGKTPIRNASRQSLISTVTSPEEKMPTGKPMESIPIITARDFTGHISNNNVGVITRMPPTERPDSSLNSTTYSHDGENAIIKVKRPNRPTERDRAL